MVVKVGNKVKPEDSEAHVNNDNKAATLHQAERVEQAVVVQTGGVEQGGVGRDIGGEGGEGGGGGDRGGGEGGGGCRGRVVVGGHDGRN